MIALSALAALGIWVWTSAGTSASDTPSSVSAGWRVEPIPDAWDTAAYRCGSETVEGLPMVWIEPPGRDVRSLTVCDESASPGREIELDVADIGRAEKGALLKVLSAPSVGPFVDADCEPAPKTAPFYLTLGDGMRVQPIVPLVACGTLVSEVRSVMSKMAFLHS